MTLGAPEAEDLSGSAGAETSNQFEYIDGQLRPTHPQLFASFAAASEQAVADLSPVLDIPYGPHPRQRFDLFRTPHQRRGTIAYYHAGYWQSRDKSGFHFLAPGLVADGFDLALVNYPLSPEASVAQITAATHSSIPAIAAQTGGGPLILAGHSAGAQLAIDLAMLARDKDWAIAGVLAISGVFDLAPLIGTSINDKLGLDLAAANSASPLGRIVGGSPAAIFAVGAIETRSFRDQTDRMARAWAAAGNPARHMVVAEADHFSILGQLAADGQLRRALPELEGMR